MFINKNNIRAFWVNTGSKYVLIELKEKNKTIFVDMWKRDTTRPKNVKVIMLMEPFMQEDAPDPESWERFPFLLDFCENKNRVIRNARHTLIPIDQDWAMIVWFNLIDKLAFKGEPRFSEVPSTAFACEDKDGAPTMFKHEGRLSFGYQLYNKHTKQLEHQKTSIAYFFANHKPTLVIKQNRADIESKIPFFSTIPFWTYSAKD